jgi:hypothetical protein
MPFRRIFFVALFIAIPHPVTASADVICFSEAGLSALFSNSENAPGINYYGFTLKLGLRPGKYPEFSAFLESGWLFGDNHKSRRMGSNLYRAKYSSLVPLLACLNYMQSLGGGASLYAGPVAGLFIGLDHGKEYERDAYYEDGEWHDRTRESHTRSHTFWGAGGEAGFMFATDKDGDRFLKLSYRFLRATSYKIFDTKTGASRNHQATLSLNFSY